MRDSIAPTHFLHALQRKHLRLVFSDLGKILFTALVQSYKIAILDFAQSQQLDLLQLEGALLRRDQSKSTMSLPKPSFNTNLRVVRLIGFHIDFKAGLFVASGLAAVVSAGFGLVGVASTGFISGLDSGWAAGAASGVGEGVGDGS